MQKIKHPESRTAFVFNDMHELFLGASAIQHMDELVSENAARSIDAGQLLKRVINTIGEVQQHKATPEHVVFYGPEATLMIRSLQALSAGALLGGEDAEKHKPGIDERAYRAEYALDEYYDPAARDMHLVQQATGIAELEERIGLAQNEAVIAALRRTQADSVQINMSELVNAA